MANLSLKHIYKVYPNGTKAVNDFNMTIDDKEFVVLVGPSGCGKSTTLRMIAGLEEITTGELKIGDSIVNDMEPKERDIAMVFQNYALYPHMTIYENIAFGLQMRHVDKDEIDRRVKEAAKTLGITDYLYKKPKEMSGGQRQRVALGRAIVREPKVMLLDEPLSNLDAKLRTQMRSEIVKLHKKLATTFIYVTHDQVEAMTMGTRIVVMKDGFIKQIDTPKNLYKYPENKFVAGFIGTPQMNFFNGVIEKKENDLIITFTDSNNSIKVPFDLMMKVKSEYLDGKKPIIIGIRAEDLKPTKAETGIKVRVSHTEELGTETLIYADMNLENDDFAEANTKVILKDTGFKEYETDGIYNVKINELGIHLFDKETEISILPRIPEFNTYSGSINNCNLEALNTSFKLPKALESLNGLCEVKIPPRAIVAGNDLICKVKGSEFINGKYLINLDANGYNMYALRDEDVKEETLSITFDYKLLSFNVAGKEYKPMPLINGIAGTFVMHEVKEEALINGKAKKKKVPYYSLAIDNTLLPASALTAKKMCLALPGREVFNTPFRYEWSPYDLEIADTGLDAEVLDIIDYGKEKFLKLAIASEVFFVKTNKEYSGKVKVRPMPESTSVVELKRNIRIV